MQVFWLKRNLRLQDSEPFYEAMRTYRRHGQVLPLYLHEPHLIRQPDVSRQHQMFVHETLDELCREIRDIGGQLLEIVGEAVDAFDRLHRIQPITRICAHQETTQACQYARDLAVADWCRDHNVEFVEWAQNGVTRAGTSQVRLSFPDYFSASVSRQLKNPRGVNLGSRFAPLPMETASRTDVPPARGSDKPHRQKGGRSRAEAILSNFFSVRNIQQYPFKISSPLTAWDGCSRMSAYLAYGVVSDREVFQAVDKVVTEGNQRLGPQAFEKLQDRARFYLDRLMWRRSYIQSLEDNPALETEPSIVHFQGARDELDSDLFQAWCAGRTGFPFIDALMRSLHETGWINMRGRAALVSFATMNLWQPTVRVAEYLAAEFMDYDPAVHFPIHQVVSGQAAAENGLMVYDPVKQGRDHDPEGQFIRRFVPELMDLPGGAVHDLSLTSGHISDRAGQEYLEAYPAPIVDHKATSKVARKRVHALQKGLNYEGSELQTALINDN